MANNLIEIIIKSIVEGDKDISELEKLFASLQDRVKEIADGMRESGDATREFTTSAEKLKVIDSVLNAVVAEVDAAIEQIGEMSREFEAAGQSVEKLAEAQRFLENIKLGAITESLQAISELPPPTAYEQSIQSIVNAAEEAKALEEFEKQLKDIHAAAESGRGLTAFEDSLKSIAEAAAETKVGFGANVVNPFAGISEGLGKTEDQSEEAKKDIDSLKDSVKKTGDEGGKAIEGLNTAMTSLGAIAINLDGKFGGVFRIVQSLQHSIGLLGIAGATAALISMTKSVADLGSELRKTSVLTGIGIADLGGLKIAAEQNESSLSQLSIGLRTFNREISQAVTSGGAAQKQFLQLGITNQQLSAFYDDTGAALETVAKKILEAGTATKQTELAVKFFGRAGRELIPLLKEIGEKGLANLRKEAEAAGLVMSGEAASAAKKFNDNLTTLSQTVQGFTVRSLTPLIEGFNKFVASYPAVVAGIGAITAAFIGLAAVMLTIKAFGALGISTGLIAIASAVGLAATPLAGLAVIVGAAVAALILFRKEGKATSDSLPELEQKLNNAKKELKELENASLGASEGANKLRESISQLAAEAERKKEQIKEIADQIERIESAGANSEGARNRLKMLREAQLALAGDPSKARDLQRQGEREQFKGAIYNELSEQAQALLRQIGLLRAEAAKTSIDISQQTANSILEQTGRLEDFYETTRRNQEAFRRASLVAIEEERANTLVGTSEKDAAAVNAFFNQKIADLNRNVAKKFQDQIEQAGLIVEKIQKELSAAFEGQQKAELELGKTRVEIASRSLELSVAQINNVDELIAKAKEINALERANLEAAIKINEQKLRELNSKALGLNYEDDNGIALKQNEAEQRKITAEIEKQNAQLKESNNRIRKILDQLLAFRKIDFDIDATKAQTALTGLTTQLDRMKEAVDLGENIPFSEFLRVAKEIDAIQARIRQGQIDFQALSIQALERQKQESVLNEDERLTLEKQIVLERAKLELMTKQAEVSRDEQERRQKIELERSIDALAGSSAKSFVDRLLQGLQDKKIDFQEFFAGLGKTLVSDLLQEVVKEGLKSGLRAQAELLGEKPADTAGGQFLQTMKFLLNSLFGVEFGKAAQKAADPLVTAADAIKQAGESSANAHKSAAELHLQAAGALLQAGNNLAGVGPGGIKIAGQTPASVSDGAGAFAEAFAEAANEAFTENNSGSSSTGGSGVSFDDSSNGGGFNLGSLFGGGAGIAGGIGAIMGGGGGIGGILSKIQGGIGAIKGITDIIGSIDKIFGGVDVLGRFDFPRIGSDVLSGGGGFFDFLKDIPFLGDFLGFIGFAKGGMVSGGPLASAQLGHLVSSGAIRKFRTGDMVRGATLGVIGEEGPEIVARMKPAGSHDMRSAGEDSDGIRQNIYIVDQRRQNLGPEDVELIIEDSMARGRRVSKAVENVIKRRR